MTTPDAAARRSGLAQAIADHPNPFPQLVVGVVGILATAYLVYRQYPASIQDKIFDGVWGLFGICALPTVPTWIATGAKNIGPAIGGIVSSVRGKSGDGGAS